MALASPNQLVSILDPNSTKYRILEVIAEEEGAINSKEISEKISVAEKTVRNNLSFLLQNQLVSRPSRDTYEVIPGIFALVKICGALLSEVNKK